MAGKGVNLYIHNGKNFRGPYSMKTIRKLRRDPEFQGVVRMHVDEPAHPVPYVRRKPPSIPVTRHG